MVSIAPVTIINCRCLAVLSVITRVSYRHAHPLHLQAFLSASCIVLSLKPPPSLTAAWCRRKCPWVDGGDQILQYPISLLAVVSRLVIELIDSSRQHPSSSLKQFYSDDWQVCEIIHFFHPPVRNYITYKTRTRCGKNWAVKNLIWVSLTSLNMTLFLKLCAHYVRKAL